MLEYLGDKTKANEEDASLVIAQLIETLCYLHKQNIVHLDVRVGKKDINKERNLVEMSFNWPDGK